MSVCSGIEAASVAWESLGWTAVAFSEIEEFPCAVLRHRFPNVPNLGDMTKFHEWPDLSIDLLVGGCPCQAFSIAGLREGLNDPRGNLTLTFLGVVEKYKPRWVVYENVPGILSSTNGGPKSVAPDRVGVVDGERVVDSCEYDETSAFACLLAGLAELGYGWAYRSLDAQYAGVAQRRERVFVVGYLGDWTRAAQALFEPESMSGNPPPSRSKGKDVAGTIAARTTGGGGLGTDFDLAGGLQASVGGADENDARDGRLVAQRTHPGLDWPQEIAPTLNAHFGDKQGLEDQHINGGGGLFVPSRGHLDLSGLQIGANGCGHESPDSRADRRFL